MKRCLIIFLTFALLLGTFCGCAKTARNNSEPLYEFYYLSESAQDSGAALAAEQVSGQKKAIDAVLQRLLEGPQDTALYENPFPAGTSVLGWSLQDGCLTLDLSDQFSRLSAMRLVEAEYSIVLTVTQLDQVDSVIITADGQPLPGMENRALQASDVLLSGELQDPSTLQCNLYFPIDGEYAFGTESRQLLAADDGLISQANAVLQALIKGPEDSGLEAFLNLSGQITVSSAENGICVLSIDQSMLSAIYESDSPELVLYAIADSMAELDGIDGVLFEMDGESIEGMERVITPVYEF